MSETDVRLTQCAIASSGLLVIKQIGAGVGVLLFDPTKKIGAGLHILASNSGTINPKNPVMYANTAIPFALEQLRQKGAGSSLSVAIAGGAVMLGKKGVAHIGPKNVEAVKASLAEHGLRIKLDQTGGTAIRTMILNIDAGKIKMS